VLRGRDPLLHGVIQGSLASAAPLAEITVVTDPPVIGSALLGLASLGAAAGAEERLRVYWGHASAR